MSNDQITQASEAATALLSWLEIAGLPYDGGRSYPREELNPLVEGFNSAFTSIANRLTGSCRELIEVGMKEASANSPRIRISTNGRDCLTRGLALFCLEAKAVLDAAE